MNLTAMTETGQVMERHVEDSLEIILSITDSHKSHCGGDSCGDLSLVDMGSATGLPGLVLAIACPRQNLGRDVCYREKYDLAVARAIAEMSIFAKYCLPLVCVGGMFVATKGHDPEDKERLVSHRIWLKTITNPWKEASSKAKPDLPSTHPSQVPHL